MSLASGTKLGPYEIVAPLGAGGMGEVYRAKDTRLDRDVAVKVLPAHLTRSPEFKQRFEREARSISQLTHPNICTLHDIGQHDGTDFLVMELLEGETLAQRLTKGSLPLEQVLRHGVEIASALDAAHRKGVVHRDLKPGNVMLTKAGAKLLDFGLAKSSGIIESDPSAVTVSQPLTSKGTLLGTFQYMAPEQLEGIEADARTDIFAFGAVLYEMATGKRAFEGHSRASLIASIMTSQPRSVSELQPMTPPALDRLIRKCLAKDPDSRWQSAGDIADEIRWIGEGGSQVGVSAAMRPARKNRERFRLIGALVLLAASVSLVALYLRNGKSKSGLVWSSIVATEGTTFVATGDLGGPAVVSPDGTTLAFVAAGADGQQRVWIRPLNGPTARVLPGTEGATFPFWSGDSRSIGYFGREKLYTVSAAGGPSISVCDAPAGRGGTWNREGVILFSPGFRSPIYRVSATGGKSEALTTVDDTKHTSHRWPGFCPDGRHFLYLAITHGAAQAEVNAVYMGSLEGGESRLVMRGSADAAVASGHLLFLRDNTLMAAPFDVKSARFRGEPTMIAAGILYDLIVWRSCFSVSGNGVLALHTGAAGGGIQMMRIDRSGKELGPIGEPDNFGTMQLSPDGTRIATDIAGAETDVWVYEAARGVRTRLTFADGSSLNPVWSPDGQSIIYATIYLSRREVKHRINRRPAIGGDEEVLYSSSEQVWTTDWSLDGNYLLFSQGKYIGADPSDIWVLPLGGDRQPFAFLKTPFAETGAKFSPDGKWIAYTSNESGRSQVYIKPFHPPSGKATSGEEPLRGGKWQVSVRNGSKPEWRPDGKELFYWEDVKVTAVEVSVVSNGIQLGAVTPLFTANTPSGVDPFDVSPDGEWFVANTSATQSTSPITLITNWPAAIKKP